MVFKPNIPQAPDFISQSQKDMIGNFETVNYVWGKQDAENENIGDHVALTDPKIDDQGAHKKLNFVEQSVEPAPGANEITLFAKDVNSKPELFYRRDGDAAGIQLTSERGIVIGGLVLRAFVTFDSQGNILQREELDEEGETIKVNLSYNVSSVTPNVALVQNRNINSDWNINFTNNLPTADFFWDYRAYVDHSEKMVQAQPYGTTGTTYADACSTSRFRAYSKNIPADGTAIIGESGPVLGRLQRMVFQAYTVA